MIMFFMINMFMISTTFMFIKHPLSMMLYIIIYTINICMMIGLINKTFWFSYILFLIMLGGMMILFMYMTNLASNEIMNFNLMKFTIIMFIMLITNLTFMFLFNDYMIFYLNMNNKEMIISNFNLLMNYELNMFNNKIFLKYYNFISLMLMSYLFINLVAIVKIININKGPLRINKN